MGGSLRGPALAWRGEGRGGEGPGSIKHQASRTNGSSQEAKRGRTERPSTWVDVWADGAHRDEGKHGMCEGEKRQIRSGMTVWKSIGLQLDLKGQFNEKMIIHLLENERLTKFPC